MDPRSERPAIALLLDLRDTIAADELEDVLRSFAAIAGADRSSRALHEVCGPSVDLTRARDREALLVWLRAWGCRHLRREDTRRSSDALRRWWKACGAELPPRRRLLTDLRDGDLTALGSAYATLARTPAAARASSKGDVEVAFGDTAAAKALYALRPEAVPPWDEPIRRAFGWQRVDADGFASYLGLVRAALLEMSARFEVPVAALPRWLGRPGSSAVKIVDEFLWMRVTHGAG